MSSLSGPDLFPSLQDVQEIADCIHKAGVCSVCVLEPILSPRVVVPSMHTYCGKHHLCAASGLASGGEVAKDAVGLSCSCDSMNAVELFALLSIVLDHNRTIELDCKYLNHLCL